MKDQKAGASATRPAGTFLKVGFVAIFAVLVGVLAFRLLFDAEEAGVGSRPKHVPVQLTAQQETNLPLWGQKIARLMSEDLGEELSQMHDYGAIAELTLEGTDGKEVHRTLDRMMKSAVTHKAGGFLAGTVGHPAHFLRVCTRAGFPAVTLRVRYGDQQFSYVDVLVQPAGDEFKIVDIYDYLKGARRTEDFRYAMVPVLVTQDSQGISTWLKNWNMQKSDAEYLMSLFKARIKGVDDDILMACDGAPEHMRSNKIVIFTRCQALQRLTLVNPRYERLYFEALKNLPPMPGTPHVLELLLIPKLLAAADYQTADDAMEKVMSVIGEDAQLMCMRAEIKWHLMDTEAAKALLRRAQELEPGLPLLQEMKQQLQFSRKSEC